MKKTLVALAIAGACTGAAFAQSTVTLYGIVDAGYQYDDYDRAGAASVSGIQSGIRNGSRWGLRGSEDLGGGLRAILQLESGFSIDSGSSAQSGRLFGRQAYAGLAGNWGTFALGRFATFGSGTGSFDMIGSIDPFIAGYGLAGLQSTMSEVGALRIDNTLMYRTPNISGFQAGYMHSFAYGSAPTQEAAGVSNNLRVDSFGASYGAGPFYAAFTYLRGEFATVAAPGTTPDDQKMIQVGATWDFKVAKLHGMYADEKGVRNTLISAVQATAEGTDATAWMIGVSVPLGPLDSRIMASYQDRDGKQQTIGTTTYNADRKVWAIGYEYMLSRRTYLHAYYADGSGANSLSEGIAATDFANRKQYSLGMTHTF